MSHVMRPYFGLKLPWAKADAQAIKSDLMIKDEILEAVRHCRSLKHDEIEIKVQNGVVSLSGLVSSLENRRLAGDAAYSVNGVEDVINYLTVDF